MDGHGVHWLGSAVAGILLGMLGSLSALGAAFRVRLVRLLARLGLREDAFLLILAILIGVVTAGAAVAFHELITWIRESLYTALPEDVLYGRGVAMLIVLPALGGLVVGIIARLISHAGAGHGVVDVMESIIRTRGFIKPAAAGEKILTSALTIGSGGSAGAEGPIVQIGAAIASGVGQLFRVTRQQMPLLIGCGSAAGISAIFNSPIGGVLFTLEVLLQDFSIRTFTPVVIASVVANLATKAIFLHWFGDSYGAIFALPESALSGSAAAFIDVAQIPYYALLGLLCGALGVSLTRLMYKTEEKFSASRIPRWLRPAMGGAVLGSAGVFYVIVFGWLLLGTAKPFEFHQYPMPAFFGDGYGVITQMLDANFYLEHQGAYLLGLLAFLCIAKVVGTCLTLSSGGSGGVIAPSIFLGAAGGGLLGMVLKITGHFPEVQPNVYALVGMGAVLAAVVHAPLASILILLELTRDDRIIVPAMLASVVATGLARLIFPDSIYTLSLRRRGVKVGQSSDLSLLRRMSVEQVKLEPAASVRAGSPFQQILDLLAHSRTGDFPVLDQRGKYAGMVTAEEIKTALLQREAIPLLLVDEIMRRDIPLVRNSDDLASVLDAFALYDVSHLPVCTASGQGQIIGMISRSNLMRRYQEALAEG